MAILEICVESVEAAIAAEAGGAQRIELCSSLNEGGLTPSIGTMRIVRSSVNIAVHAMIRPRAGDFLYSEQEFAAMREDIAAAAECGMDGIALGLLKMDGNVDVARTSELIELAHPMEVTFHRAIDMTPDVEGALEDVIRAGANRILTSGAEPTAMQGRNQISNLIRASAGRISVMAGGGVRADNVRQIAQAAHATEYHASLRRTMPSSIKYQRRKIHLGRVGADEYAHNIVRAADVRTLRKALDAALEGTAEVIMESVADAPGNLD